LLISTLHTHCFCYVNTIEEPPGIADALGYLHDYLQQLLERQNNAKTNINTALTALTIQFVTNFIRTITPGILD